MFANHENMMNDCLAVQTKTFYDKMEQAMQIAI